MVDRRQEENVVWASADLIKRMQHEKHYSNGALPMIEILNRNENGEICSTVSIYGAQGWVDHVDIVNILGKDGGGI